MFEVGDTFQGTFDTYQGTLSTNDQTFIVTFNGANYTLFSGAELADSTFPASFDLADVNPTFFTVCFATDTLIATPDGERRVQDLAIGDPVTCADGRIVPVKWIGHQTISSLFAPAQRLRPIRLAAGCIAPCVPHCDLTVTADHGLVIDGVICAAGALVNHTTITPVSPGDYGPRCTVYHIETEAHELILANGMAAETFIDNVSRRSFDNFAEFDALYGDVPDMRELPLPRAISARQVPQAIARALALPRRA